MAPVFVIIARERASRTTDSTVATATAVSGYVAADGSSLVRCVCGCFEPCPEERAPISTEVPTASAEKLPLPCRRLWCFGANGKHSRPFGTGQRQLHAPGGSTGRDNVRRASLFTVRGVCWRGNDREWSVAIGLIHLFFESVDARQPSIAQIGETSKLSERAILLPVAPMGGCNATSRGIVLMSGNGFRQRSVGHPLDRERSKRAAIPYPGL